MPEIGRATRLYLWTPAVILGLLGVYVVIVLGTLHQSDQWIPAFCCFTALLFPFVLYGFTLPRYLRCETRIPDLPIPAEANPGPFALVLSVALYLPVMILMLTDSWRNIPSAIPLFLVLWIFCACAYQCLAGEYTAVQAEAGRLSRFLCRCIHVTNRLFSPPALLLLGVLLMAFSLRTQGTSLDLLAGRVVWVTADYGLGYDIAAAGTFMNYFGRFVYGGSLLLSACTVVLLLMGRFSSARLRTSWAARILGLAAGFLAICSITDWYCSWLTFLTLTTEHLPAVQRILLIVFSLHWLAPLLLAISVLRGGSSPARLKTVVVFYAPLVLFDLAMTPFFLDDPLGSQVTRLVLFAFVGLQFLAWGYLKLATLPQQPES